MPSTVIFAPAGRRQIDERQQQAERRRSPIDEELKSDRDEGPDVRLSDLDLVAREVFHPGRVMISEHR
jgi:hypothetical protein